MGRMKRIPFDEVWQELARVLLAIGFEDAKAKKCARIFTENTCDGVYSHGLYAFPGFVANVKAGLVKPQVEPELVSSLGVIERWDGKMGAGPLNAEKAMKRAIELSRANGIGCVGLRNTNLDASGYLRAACCRGGLHRNLLDQHNHAHASVGSGREENRE